MHIMPLATHYIDGKLGQLFLLFFILHFVHPLQIYTHNMFYMFVLINDVAIG